MNVHNQNARISIYTLKNSHTKGELISYECRGRCFIAGNIKKCWHALAKQRH